MKPIVMNATHPAMSAVTSAGRSRAVQPANRTSARTPASSANGVSWCMATIAADAAIAIASSAARRAGGAGATGGVNHRSRIPKTTSSSRYAVACGEK